VSGIRNLPDGRRSGATLLELLIALIVLGLMVGTGLQFLRVQSRDLETGTNVSTALQNLRFAMRRLEADLRTLGTNVPGGQPELVYAGEDVIAFHADYATNVHGDVFAVYYTPGAPAGQVSAPADTMVIPNTLVTYPDTVYESAPGVISPAELIIFYFAPDPASDTADDHILYRQVNGGEPEVVARGIRRIDDQPFFRYLVLRDSTGVGLRLDSIPDDALPIFHFATIHGTAADTANSAVADSIRGVRVSFRSVATGPDGVVRDVAASRVIGFPNAGLAPLRVCGSEPLLGTTLSATVEEVEEKFRVALTWNAAVDETGGERDVVRYVIWRRPGGLGPWGDPYRSIPAGQANYSTVDEDVASGFSYQYALAAQDCTPSLSSLAQSAVINIP